MLFCVYRYFKQGTHLLVYHYLEPWIWTCCVIIISNKCTCFCIITSNNWISCTSQVIQYWPLPRKHTTLLDVYECACDGSTHAKYYGNFMHNRSPHLNANDACDFRRIPEKKNVLSRMRLHVVPQSWNIGGCMFKWTGPFAAYSWHF